MNKTFKVVFNKAHGVMTAVNEATTNMQSKKTKAVFAATVLSLTVGSALAASTNPILGAGAYYDGEGLVYADGANKFFATAETTEEGIKLVVDGYQSTGNQGAVTNLSKDNTQSEVHIVSGSSFTNNKISGSSWHDGAALSIWQQGTLGESAPNHTIAGTTFTNNVVEGDGAGGAIAFLSNGKISKEGSTTISNSTFTGNKYNGDNELAGGGAIFIEGTTVNIVDGTTFSNNESEKNGGAIAVKSIESDLCVDTATFTGNIAGKNGGAIMLWSDGKVAGDQAFVIANATFDSNTAAKKGGAIAWLQMETNQKEGQTLTIKGSDFTGNTALNGGAIYAEDEVIIDGGSSFSNNEATESGGAIYNIDVVTIADGVTFTENHSASMGGAIFSTGTNAEVKIGSNVIFRNNYSANGGALFNSTSKSMTIADGAQFIGNYAEYAGAIYNHLSTLNIGNDLVMQGNKTTDGSAAAIANDNAGVVTVGDGAKFLQNESARSGGAIYQYIVSQLDNGESSFTIGKNALFEGNSAKANGGAAAVYNDNDIASIMNFSDGTVFAGNSAEGQGGAVYVAAGDNTVNFNGSVTFSNNTAGGKLNDIHNDGTVNVNAGTLTLDGGITGTGSLVFTDGTGLNVKVGASQDESTTITNNVTLDGNVNLSMTFAPGYVGSYQLIQDGTVSGEGAFELSDNAIFNVTADAENNGTFNISLKDTSDIAQGTGANSNQAAAISALMSAAGGNETFASIATAIGNELQSADPVRKQAALDAVMALSPEAAPMVSQVQTDTAAQVFNVIGSRLGSSQGMASGDGTSGTGLWVQGMVGTTDMDDTSTARGYSADTTGLALGLEAKPSDSTKVGMGFAYTNTDVDGFLRSTDVDSYTAFLYGEYKPSNWFVNGIVSYAWANYDEQKSVLGQNIGAKYDADTFGLQVMGGLDLDASGFTVTPEVGLRYYHIGTDAYTDGMGTAVSDSDEDVLTGVIGARLDKTFEVSPSMSFEPQVRLAMTYDIVDADNSSFVTLANGSSYSVEGETLDRFGIEAGVGVKAEMGDNFELSLSYEGAWRGDYQNHAGILNAKYKF